MTRHVVLDTETTGLDFANDKIVEVGAVELIDLRPTGRTFHQYVNPGIPVPAAATDVHGLTNEFLAPFPVFHDIAPALVSFLADSPIVAHNASFDAGMLAAEFGAPLSNEIIDSLAIARRKHPLGPNSLDALCRRYGISTAHRTLHGALLDAQLLAEVYPDLIGRQPTLELVTVAEATVTEITIRQRPTPLQPRITAAELAAHAAMVETIPNSLWRQITRA